MAKLIYKFWGYAGYYNFIADIEKDTITFSTKGLNMGSTTSGTKTGDAVLEFKNLIKEADIENWEERYEPDSLEEVVMDIGHISICYVNDENNIYFTNITENEEPEKYGHLVGALAICDPEAMELIPYVVLEE